MYGDIKVINGEILNNMFEIPKVRTQAVQWCILPENELKIKRILAKYMKDKNLYSGNVEDCYTDVLDYFQKEDKVFYKHYTKESHEYKIEQYVISNLKYIFNIYRDNIKDKYSEEYNTVASDISDNDGHTYSRLDNVPYIENYELDKTNPYLEQVNHLFNKIKLFLIKKHYNLDNLANINQVTYLLFLEPISDDLETNIQEISIQTTVSIKILQTILSDLKKDYQAKEPLALDIFTTIKQCITLKS